MSKEDRFNAVIDHLMSIGKVHKQKDIASALACTETTVSQARKGVERSLTDNFLMRVLVAFPDIFSTRWLMTGEGQMLLSDIFATTAQSRPYVLQPDDSPAMVAEVPTTTLSTISQQLAQLTAKVSALTAHLGVQVPHINNTSISPSVSPSPQDNPTENQ